MHCRRKRDVLAGIFTVAVALTAAPATRAQDRVSTLTPGVKQETLLSAPLAQLPGKHITVFTGEFDPGAATPLHRHPGTELLFVLEGQGTMAVEGGESRELAHGKVVLVEPGAGEDSFIHLAANSSQTARMKTLVIVIHDEGTPLATLIREELEKEQQ